MRRNQRGTYASNVAHQEPTQRISIQRGASKED